MVDFPAYGVLCVTSHVLSASIKLAACMQGASEEMRDGGCCVPLAYGLAKKAKKRRDGNFLNA
jgi:hypothetical protein